jgi:hypothetical protein
MRDDLALLILDEKAPISDMVRVYKELTSYLINKHNHNKGITILANDEAIEGREEQFAMKANIHFFPDWKTNYHYRTGLRNALNQGELYIMKYHNNSWTFKEALMPDYDVLEVSSGLNVKPRKN